MNPPPPNSPLISRIQKRLSETRFLTFSALIHVCIVILLGGIVMVVTPDKEEGFQPAQGVVFQTPNSETTVENPPSEMSLEVGGTSPSEEVNNAPSSTEILASNTSSAFNVIKGSSLSNHISDSIAKPSGQGIKGIRPGIGNGPGNVFGSPNGQKGSGLEGTFYDLKQTTFKGKTGVDSKEYQKIFRAFIREGWKESMLQKYFKAPTKLYASQIFIPNMRAEEAPKAFNVEKVVEPRLWLAVYRGKVSPPEDGTYYFVGGGDDVLAIKFNGKVVLDRCWIQDSNWKPTKNYDYEFASSTGLNNGFARGDAITVKAGQAYDIEILIGEQPGSWFYSCVMIEKEGAIYKKDGKGNPIVHVFRLQDRPVPPLKDGEKLPVYEPGGPVWNLMTESGSS